MKRCLFSLFLLLSLCGNCVCFANTDIQISDKDKKLYNLRKNPEYSGDLVPYNADYTRKAESFLKKKNLEKANKYINLALYYYNRNPLSYVIKAELEIEKNELETAKADYQRAFDVLQTYVITKNNRKYRDYDARLYDSYTNSTIGTRINKGLIKIALKEGDIETAQSKIKEIKANWVYFDKEIYNLQGQIEYLQGDKASGDFFTDVAKEFDEIDSKIREYPQKSEFYYEKALSQAMFSDITGFALANINKAIELEPKSEYYLLKSKLTEKPDDKLKSLNKVLELNSANADAYIERAYIYYNKSKYQNALEDILKALRYGNYKEDDYVEFIGECYLEIGNYEKALEYFSKSEDCLGLKADTLRRMRKYKDALNIYNRIVNNPAYEKSSIMYCIAICKENLGNIQGAIQDYTKLINMGNYERYYDRGELHYSLKNYQATIRDMNLYIDKVGDYDDAIYIRAKAKMAIGQFSSALQDFVADSRYTLESQYNEAYCRYKIGDRYGAYKILLKIQKNDNFMLEDMKTYQKAINLLNSI